MLIYLSCKQVNMYRMLFCLYGIDIREIDYDEYLKMFGTVFQDFKIFGYSVCEEYNASKKGVNLVIADKYLKEIINYERVTYLVCYVGFE